MNHSSQKKNLCALPSAGSVVGTVPDQKAVSRAAELRYGEVDYLETRLDLLPAKFLPEKLLKRRIPLIATCRDPEEGGNPRLGKKTRRDRLMGALGYCTLVDVEVARVRQMGDVIREARNAGRCLILSHHDFQKTPSLTSLSAVISRAVDAGADVVKIATWAKAPADIFRLVELLEKFPRVPLAVMGMGPYGQASRLLLAQAGSVLNYGWLTRPQVSGQWPATELARLLKELGVRKPRKS